MFPKNKIKYSVKRVSVAAVVVFLSAGCSLFQSPTAAGVIKSVNGGTDWQFSNAISGSKTSNISQLNVAKLAFDPQNRETVFVGSYSGGLYKSTDSGASWSNILSKIQVFDFVISPNDSKTIYAAGVYSGQGKVLKTTDGGATWQQIYNEASANNPVRAIAINSATSTQLFIGTASGNVIKSSDGGSSWQLAENFGDQVNRIFWRPDGLYVLLNTKGLFRGSPVADNFQGLTDSLTKTMLTDFVTNNELTFHQAYVDPLTTNLQYVTTNRGLYKTTDGGVHWNNIALPVQQSKADVRAIAVAPTSSNIIFTNVDGVIYKSADGGANWQTQAIATAGFVNYILIDPQLPQIVYGGIYVSQ